MPFSYFINRDTFGALLAGIGCIILAATNLEFQSSTDGPMGLLRFVVAGGILGGVIGVFISTVKTSKTLSEEQGVAYGSPTDDPKTIARVEVLRENLALCTSLQVMLGVGALAMTALVREALRPGPFVYGTGETLAIVGFAFCAVGAVLRVKARRVAMDKYATA